MYVGIRTSYVLQNHPLLSPVKCYISFIVAIPDPVHSLLYGKLMQVQIYLEMMNLCVNDIFFILLADRSFLY